MMQTIEIELLMDQINAYRDSGSAPPEELMNQYRRFVEASPTEGDASELAIADAASLETQGRYCEALVVFEQALQKFPQNLVLQKDWSGFLVSIALSTESLGKKDPSHAELGRTYDRLLELGRVPMGLHFTMIHHYRLIGQYRLARNLAHKILAVAPNYPGLREVLKSLQQLEEAK
ncbi:MAG: hypothetical protein H7222_04300 [Methylotenera sp.]|nr:hypothetical protein [Oligoflexia bacterium]